VTPTADWAQTNLDDGTGQLLSRQPRDIASNRLLRREGWRLRRLARLTRQLWDSFLTPSSAMVASVFTIARAGRVFTLLRRPAMAPTQPCSTSEYEDATAGLVAQTYLRRIGAPRGNGNACDASTALCHAWLDNDSADDNDWLLSGLGCVVQFVAAYGDRTRVIGWENNQPTWFQPTTGRYTSEPPVAFAAEDSTLYRYVGTGGERAEGRV
jgi:hypothetical protein